MGNEGFFDLISVIFSFFSEELPEKLKLSEVLLITTSLQNLLSLALLEQSELCSSISGPSK